MAKSRSEIQKAYRKRQKAKGTAFREKEKARQLLRTCSTAKQQKTCHSNTKNKLRNRLSRLRKRQQQERNNNNTAETSGYETLNTEIEHDGEQNNEPGPSVPSLERLIVKLPNVGKGVKKINARALSRAHRTIGTLTAEVEKLKRKIRAKSKKIERISKKAKLTESDTSHLTPKKKTLADLEALSLTPKRKRIARRQLLTCNVLMHEIHEAKKASGQKKVNSIHRIISGRVAKKYRCLKSISSGTRVSRRSLALTYDKNIACRKEQRQSLSKVVQKSVVTFFNRKDNSRTQPWKSDAKKVEHQEEKQQTKVLTDYLKNLHDKYNAKYPENTMSLSTFSRLRPTNVLLASFISRNTCQCIHHQNMALKVQSLRKAGVRISENPENLLLHKDDMDQLLQSLPDKMLYRVRQKYVNMQETKRKHDEMNLIKTKPLKGTMKLHAVGATGDADVIMTRETSCYCQVCISGSYCDTWKREEFKCITDMGTNSLTPCISTKPNEQVKSDCICERVAEISTEAVDSNKENMSVLNDIEVGSFVAAVYEKAWYIGKIEAKDDDDGDVQINFMENAKQMFKWPQTKDCVWCDADDILCEVKTLQPSGKSMRLFKLKPDEKENIEVLFQSQKM
ncbi:LOW QUALITY PROTEIN: hypothetical protein MAR_000701 [Mya arenaria]|uniref:Uncharacterized protein n=1 Tax=Mya arenaria TaxID=6604 RepID=A0ABY7FDQ9_MYAAR|nr:LOW QUALITY PROTEIN: hypothetical protein MAR_000701 [Mya arenaria]